MGRMMDLALVRAIDEEDRNGETVALDVRREAGRAAGFAEMDPVAGDRLDAAAAERLSVRAERILQRLRESDPDAAERLRPWRRTHFSLAATICVVGAFVLGLAANELASGDLGAEGRRTINLIAFPLLGLIAWNLAVYLILAIRAAMGRRTLLSMPAFLRSGGNLLGRSRAGSDVRDRIMKRSLDLAAPAAVPIWGARWRSALHAAAAAAAAGLVAGMYARGLAYHFEAAWESTFLTPEQVHGVLRTVFAPASAMTGFQLATPSAAEIAAADAARGGEPMNAAVWIHLYALTALWTVIAPRAILSAAAGLAARRRARSISLAGDWISYAERARRELSGGGAVVTVVPAGFTPSSRARERARLMAADLWGGAARVDFRDPVTYGEEDEATASLADVHAPIVFLMDLGSTPEAEFAGRLLSGPARRGAGDQRILVLEGRAFHDRLAHLGDAAERFHDRCAAWKRLAAPLVDGVALLEPSEPLAWRWIAPPAETSVPAASSPAKRS